jgi:hypothetical protein
MSKYFELLVIGHEPALKVRVVKWEERTYYRVEYNTGGLFGGRWIELTEVFCRPQNDRWEECFPVMRSTLEEAKEVAQAISTQKKLEAWLLKQKAKFYTATAKIKAIEAGLIK